MQPALTPAQIRALLGGPPSRTRRKSAVRKSAVRRNTPIVQRELPTDFAAGPIEAMRLFMVDVDNLLLTSVASSGPEGIWLPGVKTSKCRHAPQHDITQPTANCTCGLWSCKSRSALGRTFPRFMGHSEVTAVARIQQWGKVIEHVDGYRSEFARVIPHTIQWYPRGPKGKNVKLLHTLRKKYAQ